MRAFLLLLIVILFVSNENIFAQSDATSTEMRITPNDFKGTDGEKIQAAIEAAKRTTREIIIPKNKANHTGIWRIDSAILLPSNMTVIIENSTLQLSDSSRDNLFRSNNVGIHTKEVQRNKNIQIIGIGNAILKGADNPRATGDGHRKLVDAPESGRVSYGSDTGKPDRKQTGDWRNILVLMAYVDSFKMKNVAIENSHAWALSFERVIHADLSDLTFDLPPEQMVNGRKVEIHNRDGIDLRQGCKHFRINRISGFTEDDFIALTSLGEYDSNKKVGVLEQSTMITPAGWRDDRDQIEDISISNIDCKSNTRAIAIRASGEAEIHDIYINGVTSRSGYATLLVGNRNYGHPSLPGKISRIYATNLIGEGRALVEIKSPIADCVFMNGIYSGTENSAVKYELNEGEEVTNLTIAQIVSISKKSREQ